MSKFIEVYNGWQIYVIPEAYLSMPANQLIDRYVAVQPEKHQIIDDVAIGSLESSIHEAEIDTSGWTKEKYEAAIKHEAEK